MSGDDLLVLLAPFETIHRFGWPDAMLLSALVLTCGIIVVVDARERIIPDLCNVIVAGLGLVFASLDGAAAALAAFTQGIVSFAVFWLFRALYHRLRGHHGLGLGDVKFLGSAGIWIGLGGLAPLILVACAAALVALAILRLRGTAITANLAIPFGPFLVAGLLGVLAARFA